MMPDMDGYAVLSKLKENLIVQNASIRARAHLAETRDTDTGDHIIRTQSYVDILARHFQTHPRFNTIPVARYIAEVTRSTP